MQVSYKRSRAVRLSDPLLTRLNARKVPSESWDSVIRRLCGFPPRKRGKKTAVSAPLYETYVLRGTDRTYASLSKARGAAIFLALKQGQEHTEQPIKMREIL